MGEDPERATVSPEISAEVSPRTSLLLRLLEERSPAARVLRARPPVDRPVEETVRFPFLAIVGQTEMKLALVLALINPAIGGVLLMGARGTGKTTAVRGLLDLLPPVERSLCPYGCEPEAAYTLGFHMICKDCARKLGQGEPITAPDRMRLIELPLNARLEDVIGGLDEQAAMEGKVRIRRGLLAQADQNVLYVDEVNLLDPEIANAILDAAALGRYTVRRGPLAATYRARLILIASMNPEEGPLRPQIHDRFGLRVVVRGLTDPRDRLEVYRRVRLFRTNPYALVAQWAQETAAAAAEIAEARQRLPRVAIPPELEQEAMGWIYRLGIESSRAEVALLEAARAYAAADGRETVTREDLQAVAPMALRQRRSAFIAAFIAQQEKEDEEIRAVIQDRVRPPRRRRRA
ncbi:MAG: ATP-binding protein [Thermoflexus hugenholtzii]|jgi:magnesium chelatase subunit I|uniref:ATP-binding protein n=1 Tax=Thermoflexus TaxID=1495649 RepID=UPI001C78FF8E|nr:MULTISPECIES: ATP-binding protein [Thermoflexus]QWK11691.1 MAG: ATP-binding protein [Thermoflexus hugenholtzii]